MDLKTLSELQTYPSFERIEFVFQQAKDPAVYQAVEKWLIANSEYDDFDMTDWFCNYYLDLTVMQKSEVKDLIEQLDSNAVETITTTEDLKEYFASNKQKLVRLIW